MKVTEVIKKGEGLELLNVGLGVPVVGCKADISSEVSWLILSGNDGGELEQSDCLRV